MDVELEPGLGLGFPKMVGFPNKPMGFSTKNDHFGVWNGGTPIFGNTQYIQKDQHISGNNDLMGG